MLPAVVVVAATVALAAVGPACAAADIDQAPAIANQTDAGAALARLTYPAAMDEALMFYTFTQEVAPTYHADPKLRVLDARHPGLVDAMVTALRLEYRKARLAALPTLWARMGTAYAGSLNAAELRQARSFHESPAGRRLTKLMIDGIAGLAPPGNCTAPVVIYPAEPTPADDAAQAAFDATAAGRKLAVLQARLAAINAEWTDKAAPDPVLANAALAKVVANFGVTADDFARR